MTKDTFTEKISLWLDNELSASEIAELKHHLTGCAACRQTYQAMEQVDQLLRTAAMAVVAPRPGFSQRFQVRLMQQRVTRPWQIWLTWSALLLGVLLLVGTVAAIGGLTLLNISSTTFDASLVYEWLVTFIDSAAGVRVFLNLGLLVAKAGLATVQEPLFWLFVLVAVAMTGLWVRVMQSLLRRSPATAEFVF